jgi:hypothetical protein
MEMKRTFFCMPSRAMMYSATMMSLYAMGVHAMSRGKFIDSYNPQCTPVEQNRNMGIEHIYGIDSVAANHGVQKSNGKEFDEILFIDSDQTFPPDLYFRLAAHNVPIVGVNCARRLPPYGPVISKDIFGKPLDYRKKPLVKMEKIGFAATLIQREVFDAMPDFVFHQVIPNRHSWIGEDYVFCEAARKAGFHIYCDLVLSQYIGHIGEAVHYLGEK